MTYIRLAFGVILSFAVGFALGDIILYQVRTQNWYKFWISFGLGLGITSISYFIWLLWAGIYNQFYIIFELLVMVLVGIIWIVIRRRKKEQYVLKAPPMQYSLPKSWNWLLNITLFFSIIFSGIIYTIGALVFPNGRYDAVPIWNLAARFLFVGGNDWQLLFHPSNYHSEYPLLIGSSVARLWTYRSVWDVIAPAVIGFLFTSATFGLLISQAKINRGGTSWKLASLALLSSSFFFMTASTQNADVPLGYFLLGSLGCIAFYFRTRSNGFMLIAGIFLGMGIWTKNEGWLLAISVLASLFITRTVFSHKSHNFKQHLQKILILIIGMIPFLFFSLYQKIFLAPPNDLIAGQGVETFIQALDLLRLSEVFQKFGLLLFSLGPRQSVPIGILIVLVLIIGFQERAFSQPAVRINLISLAIALSGYFMIYLLTPHDLDWHLRTSLNRLFAQLWPTAVFTFILLIRLPEESKQVGGNQSAKGSRLF